MAEETQPTGNEPVEPQKKSKAGLLIIVSVLIVVIGGGVGGWFFLHRVKKAEAASPTETPAQLTIVHIDSFTVNLADPDESHFLHVTLDLGLGKAPKAGRDGESSDFPSGRVRDAILSVLTVGKADALITSEGKAQLKADILESLKERVPEIDAREVYFTEFLVQR